MPRGAPRLRTSDNRLNQIGIRLRQRRLELDMTQDTLCARLADVTNGGWIADRRDIFRIEQGRRIVSDLEVLALSLAVDCEMCWLLLGSEAFAVQFKSLEVE